MSATTFALDGSIDTGAFRLFLQRFIDTNLNVFIGSGGSGEGHALSLSELRQLYAVAAEECRGKISVYANPPEQHTAKAVIEHSLAAADAGVEAINVYGPAAWHGYRPTDEEFRAYFDEVLGEVRWPVTIAPNPIIGYSPRPSAVAEICNKHHNVMGIILPGQPDDYFIALKDGLRRDVAIHVQFTASAHTLAMGAVGVLSAEANVIPRTCRRYLDCFDRGDVMGLNNAYADLKRFYTFILRWHGSSPRWIKTAMKLLNIPGGDGGVRGPYRLIAGDELVAFREGLLGLRIDEIEEMASAAGLGLPARRDPPKAR